MPTTITESPSPWPLSNFFPWSIRKRALVPTSSFHPGNHHVFFLIPQPVSHKLLVPSDWLFHDPLLPQTPPYFFLPLLFSSWRWLSQASSISWLDRNSILDGVLIFSQKNGKNYSSSYAPPSPSTIWSSDYMLFLLDLLLAIIEKGKTTSLSSPFSMAKYSTWTGSSTRRPWAK